MRASLGGLVLGWLTFARAAYNVTVDHSETSQLTYFPASKWAEVKLGAEDSTVEQYNGPAAMASTIGAQVSFTFNGTAIYWLGYGSSNSSQFVEIIVDDVIVMVDVSFAGLGTTHQGVTFFRPNLRVDQSHNITVRTIKNDDKLAVLYHVAFKYTVLDEGATQSSIGAYSIFGLPLTTASNGVAFTSQPIAATPTTSAAGQTSGPDNHNQRTGTIVAVALVGLCVLVAGLMFYFHQRRSKIDAERSSSPYLSLNGDGPPRIGMLEASIARARYGAVESPPSGQIQATPPMDKAALVGRFAVLRQSSREPHRIHTPDLTLSESLSRTQSETSGLSIAVPHNNDQLAKKRPLLESIMFPETALPSYPGSLLTTH